MYGGHLIEKVWFNYLQAWLEQFCPDNHGHGAANQKHNEGEPQVQSTYIFVICCIQPAFNTSWFMIVMIMVFVVMDIVCHCTHLNYPLLSVHYRINVFGLHQFSGVVAPSVALICNYCC